MIFGWFPSSSLFVDHFLGSWSFKDLIPKQELGNEQKVVLTAQLIKGNKDGSSIES